MMINMIGKHYISSQGIDIVGATILHSTFSVTSGFKIAKKQELGHLVLNEYEDTFVQCLDIFRLL